MTDIEGTRSALHEIPTRLLDVALGALEHANHHAAYGGPFTNTQWSTLSVLQAAHAAELLIKARIAQEHPLLIFERLPKSTDGFSSPLSIEYLYLRGRSIQWGDLPDRLWAATGSRIPGLARFEEFGRLRNSIQHFAPPAALDLGGEALKFVFEVIDPFIYGQWGLFAVDYDEDLDPYVNFVFSLYAREIQFLVSPRAAETYEGWSVEKSQVSEQYWSEMERRVCAALEK